MTTANQPHTDLIIPQQIAKQLLRRSLIGIEQNRRVPHYQVEQYLRASALRWTFLRASFFMQNLSGTHRAEIRDRDELYVPVGRGKTSFIDVRDIGAVAAVALTQPGHENSAYDLTPGPKHWITTPWPRS